MKQSKVCYHFPTWEEQKNVMISLSTNKIAFHCDESYKYREQLYKDMYNIIAMKSTDSDPIFEKYPLLLTLQNKLGFDVYGEYVVLEGGFKKRYDDSGNIKNIYFFIGDVIRYKHNDEFRFYLNTYEHTNFNGFGRFKVEEINDAFYVESSIFYCNIIQELSKYYRGEENKFEEVGNVLGI